MPHCLLIAIKFSSHSIHAICPLPFPTSQLEPSIATHTVASYSGRSFAMPFPVAEDTPAPSLPQSNDPSELRASTYCTKCCCNSPYGSKRCEKCKRRWGRTSSWTLSTIIYLFAMIRRIFLWPLSVEGSKHSEAW